SQQTNAPRKFCPWYETSLSCIAIDSSLCQNLWRKPLCASWEDKAFFEVVILTLNFATCASEFTLDEMFYVLTVIFPPHNKRKLIINRTEDTAVVVGNPITCAVSILNFPVITKEAKIVRRSQTAACCASCLLVLEWWKLSKQLSHSVA